MANNFRSAIYDEPRIFGGSYPMTTPAGTYNPMPPPLPPRPYSNSYQTHYSSPYNLYGSGFGNTFGNGYGMYSGGGGYGSMYGSGYNRYNHNGIENNFIQLAEQSSRPAFQSIESLVSAVANIASMLESTLFAITSSFRAILGLAANVGQMKSVFAQLWSTFAIFRGLNWIYRKLLFVLKISKTDPNTVAFNEAFSQVDGIVSADSTKPSSWPIMIFLGFIFTAPYIIMKLMGSITGAASNETKDPQKWINPVKAHVQFNFDATNSNELSIRTGQIIYIAPKEIQTAQNLINTGWALATADNKTSGVIPINYVRGTKQTSETPHKEIPIILEEKTQEISSGILGDIESN